MSYILDALRKADAERERDPARGIHAQPLAGAPAAERGSRGYAIAAGAAGGLALAAAAVYLSRPAPAVVPVAAAPMILTQPVPQPLEQPLAAPVASVPATAVLPAAPPMPAPRPVAAVKAPPAAQPVPVVAPAAAVPKAPTAEAATRVLAMKDLPPDVQRDLPKLAITGGVHSDNAASRMLIVGGQVFSEGATLAPGVVLEQIRARAAVLQFRGYRFSVGY